MQDSPVVILVVPAFPQLSETFIVSKFLGLLERGWQLRVVCSRSEPGAWSFYECLRNERQFRKRVDVMWPASPRWLVAVLAPLALMRCLALNPGGTVRYLHRGWRRFGWKLPRHFYLDSGLIALKPSLVHFEFGSLAVGRTYLGELLDSGVLVSFRGYDLNYVGLDDSDYYSDVWREADALHLLGRDLWERAQRRGCPASKSHVLIPPAIDTQFFDPSHDVGERGEGVTRRLRIVSVGRLSWKKGYEYALQAVKILQERGISCEYRIIGEGDMLPAIAFARDELGLTEGVRLLGAASAVEVRRELATADIFLHAAVSEGFCNAVLEAQAMAVPVVCSDADGLAENVEDGVTGFVVPRRDPERMAEKLAQLASDENLRRGMGAAARQRVAERFVIGRQIDAFENLYEALTGARRDGEQAQL